MDKSIPNDIVKQLQDRRALLWVCQRHDLIGGEEPHDYDLPTSAAMLKYRSGPDDADCRLASFYWESVWIEGAASPLLQSIRTVANAQPAARKRQVVVLAGAADAAARVPSEEFLPVCVLPGLIDETASPDSRYGAVRARIRNRVAFDLASRIREYRGRTLVVVGARTKDDLERIYEVLEDSPITDLRLLVIWPQGADQPDRPSNPTIGFSVWAGDEAAFAAALEAASAPVAGDLPRWAFRVGKRTVVLSPKDIHRITERFVLITERDLLPATAFGMGDFEDFLKGRLDNWAAYTVGLPVARSYRSDANRSLAEEVDFAFNEIAHEENQTLTFVVQIPCQSGAGGTTMLRSGAFHAATAGYPTLLLRPEEVDLNLEDLLAFTTALSEAALGAGIREVPPVLIVFDVEHESIKAVGQTAQMLAAHGRRAVVLQAKEFDGTSYEEKRSRRLVRLRPLLSKNSTEEVEACARIFRDLVAKWNLTIEVPTVEQWRLYDSRSAFWTPDGQESSQSLFWVALRFFLTEGADFTTRRSIEDALGAWIERRMPPNLDGRITDLVTYVAALSSFRIVSPIWTVLRPVTGGTFPSQIVDLIHGLRDFLVWGDTSEELGDQVFRFAHPALAEEFLRQRGIRTAAERATVLRPVLTALSAGHAGDVWLAESFSSMVLVPGADERLFAEWDWRLDLFESLPPVVRDQSKTILHHWARCLYHSVDPRIQSAISSDERRSRFETAIEKLKKAVALPRRTGRDEHPSHLYNTLGTAYTRYAAFLEATGGGHAVAAWDEACRAFDRAIELSPGTNMEALLAYSLRLLDHAGQNNPADDEAAKSKVSDVAKALSLLDEAEDLLEELAAPDPTWQDQVALYKTRALAWLNNQAGLDYLRRLQSSSSAELGYYCEARLALSQDQEGSGPHKAIQILDTAESRGVRLQPRSILLRLSLLRSAPDSRYNFSLLLSLHEELERRPGYNPRPLDAFRHAVLCFQLNKFQEGADRFKRLRESLRRSEAAPPRVRDRWRSPADPDQARRTFIRVTRITTEWRAEGYVDDLRLYVPLRPRHFAPLPRENSIVECSIRFELNGPLAVPPRFEGVPDTQ
jgi:tetratricopeptide (TPR) repeat protein